MASTYTPIQSYTVSSSTTQINFNSINGSYTDLILICNFGIAGGTDNMSMRFNSDTGSNYSVTWMAGNGSNAYSGRYSNQTYVLLDNYSAATASVASVYTIQIANYSNSTTYKTALTRSNTAANATNANVGLWRSTSAITSVTLNTQGNNFATGSTFSLYGVKSA